MTRTSEPKLTVDDWEEIFYALEFKAREVEQGKFDDFPGEASRPDSETLRWAADLRRIMAMIELR